MDLKNATKPQPPKLHGILAEFADVSALLVAAKAVCGAGYCRWDCFSPFPIHGLDGAMGRRATRLPFVALGGGLLGLGGALLLVWWTNALAGPAPLTQLQGFPYLISGKPLFSLPANIPVLFEVTVLVSAFATGLGMLFFNKLPALYHPLFSIDRFRGVTDDKLFLAIEAADPRFDADTVRKLLESLGAVAVDNVWE